MTWMMHSLGSSFTVFGLYFLAMSMFLFLGALNDELRLRLRLRLPSRVPDKFDVVSLEMMSLLLSCFFIPII